MPAKFIRMMSCKPVFLVAVCHSPEDDILVYNFILTNPQPCATVTNVMNPMQHILIVDDDKELRTLVSDVLVNNGFRVSVAENGTAMTQTLATARVDLIILDILMPGEDGLSLVDGCASMVRSRSSC